MAGTNPYLSALAGAQPGPPPPTVNVGGPPKPTGIGAMATGSPGTSPREAASAAVAALRELQKSHPQMGDQISGWVASIISAAQANPGATNATGTPNPLGAPPAAAAPAMPAAPPAAPPPLVPPLQ